MSIQFDLCSTVCGPGMKMLTPPARGGGGPSHFDNVWKLPFEIKSRHSTNAIGSSSKQLLLTTMFKRKCKKVTSINNLTNVELKCEHNKKYLLIYTVQKCVYYYVVTSAVCYELVLCPFSPNTQN